MHAVAFHAIRTARRPISRQACRIIAGVRHPTYSRPFHASPITCRTPEDTGDQGEGQSGNPSIESPDVLNENAAQDSASEMSKIAGEEASRLTPKPRNGSSKLTSGGRQKANRIRQPEGLPPVVLPAWFLENNVKCLEDSAESGTLAVYATSPAVSKEEFNEEYQRMAKDIVDCDLMSTEKANYSIQVDVYKEIMSTLRAGLTLRPPKNSENLTVVRPVTVLQCPKDGGALFLDSVVETISKKLGADLIRLDAQDLAQIVGPYLDENLAWGISKIALLGYEAQKMAGKLEEYDNPTEETVAAEEDEDVTKPAQFKMPEFQKALNSILTNKKDSKQQSKAPVFFDADFKILKFPFGQGSQPPLPSASDSDSWNNLKFNTVLGELVGATDVKRSESPFETNNTESGEPNPASIGTIVQIVDYSALASTPPGMDLLIRLQTAITKRWKDGKNIICVGTYSSEEGISLSRPEIQHLQFDVVNGERSTIFVPPDRRPEQEVAFELDEKARIRSMNIRHLEDMIAKFTDQTSGDSTPATNLEDGLDNTVANSAGIEDAVWTYARVRRLALTILGRDPQPSKIDGKAVSEALKMLSSSDQAKFSWGAAELKEEDDDVEAMVNDAAESKKSGMTKEKLKQIKKNCNSHEKKLINGVVLPADIRTTFDNIRAPKETVEALKTLTSLSLARPEAFSYGVLATDKIPGLLLYGPPGTGKTLLAKAVAKESGATVLEVSGAEVNDMFVGEGEKNVKAVFSLAKKLSPCVVFVDEADAIFSSRGETKRSGAHRELIVSTISTCYPFFMFCHALQVLLRGFEDFCISNIFPNLTDLSIESIS